MMNRSRKIIIEACLMVLATLFGVLFGTFLNNRVFHEGHGTNWIVVICALCFVAFYAVIWAIVNIKKQNKEKDSQ